MGEYWMSKEFRQHSRAVEDPSLRQIPEDTIPVQRWWLII
jgi:hypothetical protein